MAVPSETGSYAVKLYNPSCYTNCNPHSAGLAGIAVFQTDYIVTVH